MPTTDVNVTETELEMLRVIWDRGEATRRQVADVLYPGGGESHYATVQKLLERLERKGFVRHERRDNVLVYSAMVDRDAFIGRRLQILADKLCGGALAPLVMNLIRSQPLKPAEVEELYAMLGEQRQTSRGCDTPVGH
jgi:predicted transcriptional regulator